MTSTTDVTALRENPELFRTLLRKKVEEIAAGKRIDVERESPNERLASLLGGTIKKNIFQLIDNMWEDSEINQKVAFIYDLQQKYPKDYVAWRPTTDKLPILRLKGHYLTNVKEGMQYKSRKYEAEIDRLREVLMTKATALKRCRKQIDEAEAAFADLCVDYEKLTRINPY